MADVSESQPSPALDLQPASPEVKSYQRQKTIIGIVSAVLNLVILAAFAFLIGPAAKRANLDDAIGNRWLLLIIVAVIIGAALELLTLPLDFYSGFILEHRHKLSNQTLFKWILKKFKGYAVGGIIGLPLLLGLYSLLWLGGPLWWIWATIAWLAVTLLMGRLMPVLILPLFYKVTKLEDAEMQTRLEKIAAGTGLNIEGVYRLHLSAETKKANAALTGLGRTRRVLLGDTLLDEFTPEEIEVVFAHEVGHHVYKHLPKMIIWGVVTAIAGFFLADRVLQGLSAPLGYSSFADPVALPLFLLVLSVFGLVLVPLHNVVSRYFEKQCDQYALDRTGLTESYRSAFIKLATQNKSDPDPNPIVVWLFYDHPPIRKRLALAEK